MTEAFSTQEIPTQTAIDRHEKATAERIEWVAEYRARNATDPTPEGN